MAAGDALRSGRLHIEALWPSASREAGDPNAHSLVLRARLGSFTALLTGDAEAEVAPIQPGAVDLLKVAHHGSADAGLAGLLSRASPRLAVISVGAGNPYGHPAPDTLATLGEAGVPVMRTDVAGEIAIEVRGDAWSVE
jgi:competence protein ComEC